MRNCAFFPPHRFFLQYFFLLFLTLPISIPLHAHTEALSPDQAAFAAARASSDPQARVLALQSFLERFPASPLQERARNLLLGTLLASFPDRTADIHTIASLQIARTSAGFERWVEESRLADLLADAQPSGADLDDAQRWAEDAVHSLTEDSYRRAMLAAQQKYKLPPLSTRQLHREYAQYRASFLAALTGVQLRTHQLDGAAAALGEATRLDPLLPQLASLHGQLALAQHNDRQALDHFERAEAIGSLQDPWRAEMLRLYAELDHGTPAQLQQHLDMIYTQLYPSVFQLPPRQLPAGGHTVLLELFTGSGCDPCAAPDLAIESLLRTYTRTDLIALEYDQHIPRPDPLANPDSLARAAAYHVTNTPQAFLDGQPLQIVGSARQDTENVVVAFADALEARAALPSTLRLTLHLTASGDTISAVPSLSLAFASSPAATPSLRTLARSELHIALVEDNISYSGENGIRFHRMVVRSLTTVSAAAYLTSTPPGPVIFRPTAINTQLSAFLAGFEDHNDRFGPFRFSTTALPLNPHNLAIVIWVQDPSTQEIFQSAYAPVPPD